MKIPTKLSLYGLDINVVTNNEFVKMSGCIGKADYNRQMIVLDREAASEQITEQSYLHELTHFILFVMEEHELRTNEKFVDRFASLLHQAITTGEKE
jgi:hypothetical protein